MDLDFIKSAIIANSETKGYKFNCSGHPLGCRECGKKTVSFITQDLEEAYQHSLRNSVTMWISKD